MNRHQRRAAAASRAAKTRHAAVSDALDCLTAAAMADPTVTGATLLLPNGETLHLSADTARARATSSSSDTAGRA